MTYFLSFRTAAIGGAVVDPYLLEGDGTTQPPSLSPVADARIPSIVAGRSLLFAAHGFNVSELEGTRSLGLLDSYLDLASSSLFIGILWPGDSWLPIVDYPFEGDVALDCGARLAEFCNNFCAGAQSISF